MDTLLTAAMMAAAAEVVTSLVSRNVHPHGSSSITHAEVPLQRLFRTIIVPGYTIAVVCYVLLKYLLARRQEHEYQKALKQQQQQKQRCLAAAAATRAAAATTSPDTTKEDDQQQPVDLTGVWKLQSNDNFEGFLEAQGVPWALRSAANRVWSWHKGIMNQDHRIIDKEWLLTISTHEVANKVAQQVRSV